MYGWRARLGIIYGTGFTDHEYYQVVPDGVAVHITRVPTVGRSEFALGTEYPDANAFLSQIESSARTLGKIRPAAVVWMTTSGSFSDPDGGDGPDWDRRLKECMAAASGAPSTTTSTCVVEAMRALGVSRVSIASPYEPEAERKLARYLAAHDVDVVATRGLACKDVWQIGNLGPEVAYRTAVEADRPQAEAVFIAETSFRSMEVIEALEADLGKPVFSANGASMWHTLRLAGIDPRRQGLGTLFTLGRPRSSAG